MTKPAAPPRVAHPPSLRQLRGFQAVARQGSFSGAARSLSLTQPALSAAVRELEDQLGAQLFERSTHHVALTAAGSALLPQVEWLLNSFSLGVDDMRRTLAAQGARLRVGALPSAMHLAAPAVAEWHRKHPEVALELRDLLNDELLTAVQTGALDIALGVDLGLPAGVTALPVGSDEMVAVLPEGHRLADRSELRWRELKGERLALFSRGSTYELALSTLRQQGVSLAGADRLQYSESLYSVVRSGLAVGLISRLYTHALPYPDLRVLPLRSPAITRRIALLVRGLPGPRSDAAADCFAHLARSLKATLGP